MERLLICRRRRLLAFIIWAAIVCAALYGCGGTNPNPGEVAGDEPKENASALNTDAQGQEELAQSEKSDEATAAQKEPEPEPEPLDPATCEVGAVLSAEEIERAGGEDAFFFSEEIPDEVFARMEGLSFGPNCTVAREDLRYVRVLHADANANTLVGELVVNRRVADEVVDIFHQLYDARYPIRKMHLVDDYGAQDEASCEDDNTSSFNFRLIAGTNTISNHAYGLAIDINTYENPYYIVSSGYLCPADAERYLNRSLDEPYMIHPGDLCYQLFTERGWGWGGDWPNPLDYQHFEKPQALYE